MGRRPLPIAAKKQKVDTQEACLLRSSLRQVLVGVTIGRRSAAGGTPLPYTVSELQLGLGSSVLVDAL